MPISFQEASNKYNKDEITELGASAEGRRFLLLRSLSRGEHLEELVKEYKIGIGSAKKRDLFQVVYKSPIATEQIKRTIKTIFARERAERVVKEQGLIDELYKLKEFYWGGLHQNSLDKTIVNNYVKKIQSFEELNKKIDKELFESMRGYVRCSWYNHWTSIIIEDIFKEHANVLPAVGLVKKIDFFIRDVPFDLKVTYLPEGYVKEARRNGKLKPELTLLKQACRQSNLKIDNELNDADLLEHLWAVIADQPGGDAKKLIQELRRFRLQLVTEIEDDPEVLIKWLYENQGERRFDSANRLFLILVNEKNFFDSWQLKRNRALLSQEIGSYLDSVTPEPGTDVTFSWEGASYTTRSDVIVIRHSTST